MAGMTEEVKALIRAARKASIKAKREANALGLTVRIIEKGIIYDKKPSGEKIRVGLVTLTPVTIKVKKGTVLHLKDE
jgi:hypothetical protein